MRTFRAPALLLTAASLLSGCLISKVPLGPEKDAVDPGALLGRWQSGQDESMEIAAVPGTRRYWIVSHGHDSKTGKPTVSRWEGWSTGFKGHTFANLRQMDKRAPPDYFIIRYEAGGEELVTPAAQTAPAKPYASVAALRKAVADRLSHPATLRTGIVGPKSWRRVGPPPIAPDDFPRLVPVR